MYFWLFKGRFSRQTNKLATTFVWQVQTCWRRCSCLFCSYLENINIIKWNFSCSYYCRLAEFVVFRFWFLGVAYPTLSFIFMPIPFLCLLFIACDRSFGLSLRWEFQLLFLILTSAAPRGMECISTMGGRGRGGISVCKAFTTWDTNKSLVRGARAASLTCVP